MFLALAMAAVAAPPEIVVAVPLTGSSGVFGRAAERAVTMVSEEMSHANVRFTFVDTESKPEVAEGTLTPYLGTGRPLAVLGEIGSSRTVALAKVAQAEGIPLLTPTSTSPAITPVGDFVFRACFEDPEQGTAMGRFAAEDLHAGSAALLVDERNNYSMSLAERFVAAFPGTVTRESYAEQDFDFRAQVDHLLAAKPDVLYVPGYYTEAALIARQAREHGFKGTFLGGDGWDSPKLGEIGGVAVEGAYFTSHFAVDAPGAEGFTTRWRARWKEDPDSVEALTYDAARMLLLAVDAVPDDQLRAYSKRPRARAAEARRAVRDALAGIRDFSGATGLTTMRPDRNPEKPVYVVRIDHGAPRWAATVPQTGR